MYTYNSPEVLESDSLNSDSHMLSELLLQSLVKEMKKPEMSQHALSWRRLHLSRAKLKASSRTSALLAGFAMVAMVEVQLAENMPTPLLVAFSVCTTLLVAIHMLALMISTCILPHLEAVASVHGVTAVAESPHDRMHIYIETAWAFSTVFGIILFLSEIAILCWVKFHDYREAAIGATVLLIPLLVVFVGFAVHFYRKLVTHQYERSEEGLRELEKIMKGLQGDGTELGVDLEGIVIPSTTTTSANGPGVMDI